MTAKILRTKAAAEYLGCSATSITRWVRAGLLQCAGKGRSYHFTTEQLDEFRKWHGSRIRGKRKRRRVNTGEIPLFSRAPAPTDEPKPRTRAIFHVHIFRTDPETNKRRYEWARSVVGEMPTREWLRLTYGPGRFLIRTEGQKDQRWTIGADAEPPAHDPQDPPPTAPPADRPVDQIRRSVLNHDLMVAAIDNGEAGRRGYAALLRMGADIIDASHHAEDRRAFWRFVKSALRDTAAIL